MNIYIRHEKITSSFNLDGYPDAELMKTGLKQAHLTVKRLSKVMI